MKIKVLAAVFALCLMLAGCGKSSKIKTSVDDLSGTATVTDLGVSSQNDTTLASNARNPWDIAVIDGEVYTAVGDYSADSSPTSFWKYDSEQSNWVSTGESEQEAILRFLNLNGKTIAIGGDPAGRPEYAENYVLNDGEWQTFVKIKGALHTFDAEYLDGAYYFGVSYDTNDHPVVKYDPKTKQYTNIPLHKNGVDVILAEERQNTRYKRVYDLFLIKDRLYCILACYYVDDNYTVEFFELKGDKFQFCTPFIKSGMVLNRPIKNQVLFNSSAVMGDSCYITTGNLYKTRNFKKIDEIDVPEGECVTDLFCEEKKRCANAACFNRKTNRIGI
ncbi:MAG: hypothetical protein Q4B40_06830 [Clostridia bacterium]|nr:hypothetical protein [Clostridia bacterium]